MTTLPKVSIIIPAYNQARFVAQTVDSALAQTWPEIEVIVVNDGSTDNTADILAGYGERIRLIHQENRGLAGARNTGVKAACGDYLLFLDSDDLIPNAKVEHHLKFLAENPDFDLVYSGWQYIDETGAPLVGQMRPGKQGTLLTELLFGDFYCIPGAVVIRRKVLEQVGLFDETLRAEEDTDMWLRAVYAGYRFGYIDELLFQYRIHSASLSAQAAHQVKYAFARLDKFFAQPGLPAEVLQLRPEAYSRLHYVSAARFYRIGQIEAGQEQLRRAAAVYPPLAANREWLAQWAISFALSLHTPNPDRFLACLFDNLPPEAGVLKTLQRQVVGQYHTGAIFRAHLSNAKNIHRHVWPALAGNPQIISNRGFLKIVIRSLLG